MEAVKTTNYDPMLSTRAKLPLPTSPLLAGRRGVGPAQAPLYHFAGGLPDPASFPLQGLTVSNAEMLVQEGRDALTYGALYGYQGLRELVCEKTRHFDGFEISPDNVLITNGSSHALSLAADLLVDVGDPVIVEAPTFSGTLYNFRRFGPELIGVSLDD